MPENYGLLVKDVTALLEASRRAAARSVNSILTGTYWEIGRRIVEFEQKGSNRAGYGEEIIGRLAQDLTSAQAVWLRSEIKKDFTYFHRVVWNSNLEEKSVEFIRQHTLKTLDSIQLAAGVLSKADSFVTSDRQLFLAAKSVIPKAHFI